MQRGIKNIIPSSKLHWKVVASLQKPSDKSVLKTKSAARQNFNQGFIFHENLGSRSFWGRCWKESSSDDVWEPQWSKFSTVTNRSYEGFLVRGSSTFPINFDSCFMCHWAAHCKRMVSFYAVFVLEPNSNQPYWALLASLDFKLYCRYLKRSIQP